MQVNKSKFEISSSLEYYHMTHMGKAKHTSWRGLLPNIVMFFFFRTFRNSSPLLRRFSMDPSWSETGDRYLLKLFRDYLFHQVTESGAPWLDLAHIVACLNKVSLQKIRSI